jgi:hypothetical protein
MTRPVNNPITLAALLCAGVLLSCDWYEKNTVQSIDGPVPAGAGIKFFNFGVGSPSVNFYAGSRKMTAVVSTTGRESPNGVAYGGVGAGGFYTALEAGQYTLSGKIADTASVDHDLAISTLITMLEGGKFYSFYQSGTYTPKTVDAFIVQDAFGPQIDYSGASVRLVNAIFNANPLVLYATKTAPPDSGVVFTIGAAVAYKGAGAFTPLPGGVYDLAARYVDSTANTLSRTGVSFLAGRVYTITARGDVTVAPNTTACPATSRTCLDNTANR